MVERFHRSLKASLMSRCTSDRWKPELPWVLLGLRTAPKEDGHSPAARVYGDSLTVPGDFFRIPSDPSPAATYETVEKLLPCRPTHHPDRRVYMPDDLAKASHVFIRVDASKPPLTPPYTGPYKVLERKPKAFRLQIRNSTDWVSIDRLKPAYLLADDVPEVKFSRAGRPLRKRRLSRGGSNVVAT